MIEIKGVEKGIINLTQCHLILWKKSRHLIFCDLARTTLGSAKIDKIFAIVREEYPLRTVFIKLFVLF